MTWCRAVIPEGAQLPYTHQSRPAVVQRFTARGPSGPLREALREYAGERLRVEGCLSRTGLEVAGPPASFVHLEQWRDFGALRRASHRPALLPRLVRVERLAECSYDVAVSVGRMPTSGPLSAAGSVTVLRCVAEVPPERFELAVGSLLGPCVADEGCQGSELLRSVTAPLRYTVLVWWRDAECAARVLRGPDYLSRLRELERLGGVEESVPGAVPAD